MTKRWIVRCEFPAAERRLECSPGRKPGVNSKAGSQAPEGRKIRMDSRILRPYGLGLRHYSIHGLAPVATFLRRFAAGAQIVIHSHFLTRGAYILTPLRGWKRANCNSFTLSYAWGYILTPLRGWNAQIVIHSHFLTRGATL